MAARRPLAHRSEQEREQYMTPSSTYSKATWPTGSRSKRHHRCRGGPAGRHHLTGRAVAAPTVSSLPTGELQLLPLRPLPKNKSAKSVIWSTEN
jgi:hypothetical protein